MEAGLSVVAHELVTAAEPGFEGLTLWASRSGGSSSFRLSHDVLPYPMLMTLDEVGTEGPVVFEMRVEADGTFEALVTDDGIMQGTELPPSYTVLLKPRYPAGVPTASSLAEVEAVLGASLPTDVHELYARGVEMLLPPDQILDCWDTLAESDRFPVDWEWPVEYIGPPGAVRTVRFHPLWVPIAATELGDLICVDLAPGPHGRVGQLIQAAGDVPLTYLADSAADWQPSAESPDYDGLKGHLRGPEGVAELPETVQNLVLIDPGDLDFGRLSRLTALRALTVVGGASVRLGGLAHLPLQRLDVSGDEIELPACETLTSLKVGGARVELPSLPQLRVLDVSGADVDVESLPQVDYLTLTVEQWQRCDQRPAAATLVGESSFARALDWARGLGADLPHEVISGRAFPRLP